MKITLDSYVNVHSRSVGRKTETFDTKDIEGVTAEHSHWVDGRLIRVRFKSGPPSMYFNLKEFNKAIEEAKKKQDD